MVALAEIVARLARMEVLFHADGVQLMKIASAIAGQLILDPRAKLGIVLANHALTEHMIAYVIVSANLAFPVLIVPNEIVPAPVVNLVVWTQQLASAFAIQAIPVNLVLFWKIPTIEANLLTIMDAWLRMVFGQVINASRRLANVR
jgi:hypothetical protein